MLEIFLSHWATYFFLFWVIVIAAGNLWPRKRADSEPNLARPAPTGAELEVPMEHSEDEIALVHRVR
jgi:hypothetical protein